MHLLPDSLAFLDFQPWMIGVIIPVASLIFAGAIVISSLYFKHQKQMAWHQTARLALEKGQPVPPQPLSDEELKYAAPPPSANAAEWEQARRAQRRKARRAGFSPRWTRWLAIAVGAGAGATIGWTRGLSELFTLATVERVGTMLSEPSLLVALTITAVTLAALYVPALRRLWA